MEFLFMAAKKECFRYRFGCMYAQIGGQREEQFLYRPTLPLFLCLLLKSANCVKSAKRVSAPWITEFVFFFFFFLHCFFLLAQRSCCHLFLSNSLCSSTTFLYLNANLCSTDCVLSMLPIEILTTPHRENVTFAIYDGLEVCVCKCVCIYVLYG